MLLLRALGGGAPALLVLYILRPAYAGTLFSVTLAGLVGGIVCLVGSSFAAVGKSGLGRLLSALRTPGRRAISP